MKDYYKTLGLSYKASRSKIVKNYLTLALKFHPDNNKSSCASTKFIEINEAYFVLEYRDYRNTYDKYYKSKFIEKDNKCSDKQIQSSLSFWSNENRQQTIEFSKMRSKDFKKKIKNKMTLIDYLLDFVTTEI